jgi:hypothetical protein
MKQTRPTTNLNSSKAGLNAAKKVVEDCDTDIDQISNKVRFKAKFGKKNDSTMDSIPTLQLNESTTVKEQLDDLKITDKAIAQQSNE